ncbi:hypothetical protein MVEN_00368500 [Mycena venus]|uniref:WD40 repeat-like protein n=1 Tax=Mycena venus TaxID=2733690 RepID=A0A8H7DAV5_9AGAR|nr:hypothetical protein MVEN_00368500 [Mycena venus]
MPESQRGLFVLEFGIGGTSFEQATSKSKAVQIWMAVHSFISGTQADCSRFRRLNPVSNACRPETSPDSTSMRSAIVTSLSQVALHRIPVLGKHPRYKTTISHYDGGDACFGAVLLVRPQRQATRGRLANSALLHMRLAATRRGSSESVRWPFSGGNQRVCAFQTTSKRQFLGDSCGWLYSRCRAETLSSRYWDVDPEIDQWADWTPELSLAPHSEISALCTTSTRCVAVCFGATTKICVQDADAPDRTELLHLSTVRDVRAASLQGRALVLGAAENAVLLTDLDGSGEGTVRMLPTRSDVFTVAQQENLVYAGARAGTVLRFDTRVHAKGGQVLFESGPGNEKRGPALNTTSPRQRSSAVFVQPTHGGQRLVVGYMDGRLGTYDLRFARLTGPPIVTCAGHPSSLSHSGRLGIALDPAERFLFAAGADHRLRAWALDSGTPVVGAASPSPDPSDAYTHPPDSDAHPPSCNPFTMHFTKPLSVLQVVDDDDGAGQVLWASGGSQVWRWQLGV